MEKTKKYAVIDKREEKDRLMCIVKEENSDIIPILEMLLDGKCEILEIEI